jgi:Skp family chaperone for outer membrane proteins
MTRIPTIALALSALLVAGQAVAQTTPPPTPTPTPKPPAATTPQTTPKPSPTATPKPPTEPFPAGAMVAYVDLQLVVAQSKLGQAGHDQMTALNDKLSQAVAAKNKEIQALQDKIKNQQNLVADAIIQDGRAISTRCSATASTWFRTRRCRSTSCNEQLLQNFQAKVLPIVEDSGRKRVCWIIFALGDELEHRGRARGPRSVVGSHQAARRDDQVSDRSRAKGRGRCLATALCPL